MEKFFVRFKGGYLNLDDDAVYITTTGNWQETHTLKEQKNKQLLRRDALITWMLFLLMVGLSVWWKSYLTLALFTLLFAVTVWIPRVSPVKIPISKIIKTERSGNNLILHFYNEAGERVSQKFRKINNFDFEEISKSIHIDNIRDRNSTLLP